MTSKEKAKVLAAPKKTRDPRKAKSLTRASAPKGRASATKSKSTTVTVPTAATAAAATAHAVVQSGSATGNKSAKAKTSAKAKKVFRPVKGNAKQKRGPPKRAPKKQRLCTKCKKSFRGAAKQKARKKDRKGAGKRVTNEELVKCLRAVLEAVKTRIDSIEVESSRPTTPTVYSMSSSATPSSLTASTSSVTETTATATTTAPVPAPAPTRASGYQDSSEASLPAGRLATCSESKKKYVCPVCLRTFPWLCLLKRHLQSHEKVKVLRCPHCNFMTLKTQALHDHMLSHAEIVRCNVCDETFPSNSSPERQSTASSPQHDITNQPSEESIPQCPSSPPNSPVASARPGLAPRKSYVCPVCGQKFPWLCLLKRHLRDHKDWRIHSCPHCPFITFYPELMTEHLWTHEKGGPFRCDRCNEEFTCIRHLMRHINHAHGFPDCKSKPNVGNLSSSDES